MWMKWITFVSGTVLTSDTHRAQAEWVQVRYFLSVFSPLADLWRLKWKTTNCSVVPVFMAGVSVECVTASVISWCRCKCDQDESVCSAPLCDKISLKTERRMPKLSCLADNRVTNQSRCNDTEGTIKWQIHPSVTPSRTASRKQSGVCLN